MVPSDDLYAAEWHLALMGDLETVWDEVSGAGILVGLYDDGIDYTHPELAAAYDAAHQVTVSGAPADAMAGWSAHGTAVAGLLGAALDGTGTVGVAWGATLAGVDIFSGPAATPRGFEEALAQLGTFDVTNHSWGYAPTFVATAGAMRQTALFEAALAEGRGGLGTLAVKAAGNLAANANGDAIAASRATVVVGAYDDDGDVASYSNRGANLLVSAPSSGGRQGILTTDLPGNAGLAPGDYVDGFGGTSAASPLVAGVVALMLEANPALGWRDIAAILAYSAREIGSGVGNRTSAEESRPWFENAAGNWNGGGLHFSEDYGFGAVDSRAAVRMAEAWSHFAAPATSADETILALAPAGPVPLADGATLSVAFSAPEGMTVESAALSLGLTHGRLSSLIVTLTSPGGTTTALMWREELAPATDAGWQWTFGANAFRGERSAGTWTLTVRDPEDGSPGRLDGAVLTLYGGQNEGIVHHLTDAFAATVARDPSRAALNGGPSTDWLDGAALSGALDLDLATGSATIDGAAATLSAIENAIGGDGNDLMSGDAAGNILAGMRGADILIGAAGRDTLEGGAGADHLVGGTANDRLFGETRGAPGDPALPGGANADFLWAGRGADRLFGQIGDDTLHGRAGADRLRGGPGDDHLFGGKGSDFLAGARGTDHLDGGPGDDTLTGGRDGDVFILAPGSGHDTITDFTPGEDQLDLTSHPALASADLIQKQTDAGLLLTVANDPTTSVLLAGITALHPEDFVL